MFEIGLKSLLERAAAAQTLSSCEDFIRQLSSMKKMIQRVGGLGLESITQVNKIDRMIGILDRRADSLDAEDEFVKRDAVREAQSRKNDKYKVKPVQDEIQARKGYKTL